MLFYLLLVTQDLQVVCSTAFGSADGFPSAYNHTAEHTLPFPFS